MNKEVISRKQAISICILYWLGSILIIGTTEAGKDSWLAVIIAAIAAIPVLFIYMRLMKLYPGKDFFEISIDLFGKIGGKFLMVLYIEFSLHLAALIVNNHTRFLAVSSLPETPDYFIAIMIIILCIGAAKMGIEVIGRWSEIVVFYVLFSIIMLSMVSIPYFNLSHIKPILYDGWKPVIGSSVALISFPFADAVILIYILNSLKSGESIYKVVYTGLAVSATIIVVVLTRVILVLGDPIVSTFYYPTIASISIIDIGDFLQRLDILMPLNSILCDFIKVTICLVFASKCFAKIFNIREYKKIVAPLGFAIFVFSLILYSSTMETFADVKYSKYYCLPFQIIFPIIILVVAEIKNLINKKSATY